MTLVLSGFAVIIVSGALSFWLSKRGVSTAKAVAAVAGCLGGAVLAALAALILASLVFPTPPVSRETDDHFPDELSTFAVVVWVVLALVVAGVAGLGSALGAWVARKRGH